MKASILVAVSVISLVAWNLQAASPDDQLAPVTTPAKPVKLPYGVEDVIKLSKASISEDVIVKFIENSGTIYNLTPEVLVHLRNEGVTDRVLNTMLDQAKAVAAPTTSIWNSQPQAGPAQPQTQVAPTYVQQPQPCPQPPVSTVHVIPYNRGAYSAPYWPEYSGYYYPGYYRPYAGWYGPSISLGFGFGFGGHRHYPFRCR